MRRWGELYLAWLLGALTVLGAIVWHWQRSQP